MKLFLLLFINIIIFINPTNSYFSDKNTIIKNTVSTKYWTNSTPTPPSTIPFAKLNISNGDWSKEISEKISISNFQMVGSTTTTMIGNEFDPGDYIWNNRLSTTFPGDVKTLSLFYNFFSRDFGIYDNPGFYIRLNGQEIFKLNNLNSDGVEPINTNWQRFDYDLSDKTGDQNLIIYSGNTQGTTEQSWVNLDKITTNYAVTNSDGIFSVTGSNICWWKVDMGGWTASTSFQITEPGIHDIYYYCVNDIGVQSPQYQVQVQIDTLKPDVIDNLNFANVKENNVSLSWTSKGASRYDIRYQKNCSDIENFNFDTAIIVNNVPAPLYEDETEIFDIDGLEKNTNYCFGIKSADTTPNWSEISNIITATTLDTVFEFSFHDVIINEIRWTAGEFIEFKNTTNQTIDMNKFILNRYNGTEMVDSEIDFGILTIEPGGNLKINNIQLINNDNLYLELVDADGQTIDTAWNIDTSILTGTNSIKRITTIGDGSDPMNWYTTMPQATLTLADDKKTLSFSVKNIFYYSNLNYELTYNSEKGEQGTIGNVTLNNQNEYIKDKIILGTCSTNESCLYYQTVTDIQLKIILTDQNTKELIINL